MSIATDTLKSTFGMLGAMTTANLRDVSSDLAEKRAAPNANNAHWVLGHIVFWRNRIVGMLGGEPLWSEGEHQELEGVNKGDPPARVGPDFKTLQRELRELQSRTMAALESEVAGDVRDDVVSLALHEAYHVGQLGLLRRTMGLEGALGQ